MLRLAIGILTLQTLLLLTLRPLILWYLGISRATKLLRSIDESLKCLPAVKNAWVARTMSNRWVV